MAASYILCSLIALDPEETGEVSATSTYEAETSGTPLELHAVASLWYLQPPSTSLSFLIKKCGSVTMKVMLVSKLSTRWLIVLGRTVAPPACKTLRTRPFVSVSVDEKGELKTINTIP